MPSGAAAGGVRWPAAAVVFGFALRAEWGEADAPGSETLGSSGDTITATYDNTDTPSALALKNASTTLQSFTYADSPAGTILSETDTPSSPQSPASYAYDAQGRITSDTPGTGTAASYSFDPSSNLTTLPTGAAGTYDHAGELTSSALSGTTANYTYDADGQRLTATQGSTTLASATWNGAAEPTAYSNGAATMSAATYDGNGLRAATTITPAGHSATTQQYVWDARPGLAKMLMDSGNAYLYGSGLAPAEQVNLSTGTITYLVTDSLGSVRGTVSSAGALSGTAGYDAWGNPQAAGGLTSTTPFGFAGGYTDADGLIYLQARYYDPSAGQFVSVDPVVSQTLQPYEYASGNPVSNTDPTGLLTRSCGVNLEWYGVKLFCAFYFTKSQTRTYQNDINNLGGGTAAIIADGAVCGFLPLTPTWYKAVCIAIAAAYEVWTVHDIDVAVQNKGCLDFSVNLKSFFGIISGDVHPNWIGPSSRYCK
jgi:RHS repeat-associated protein